MLYLVNQVFAASSLSPWRARYYLVQTLEAIFDPMNKIRRRGVSNQPLDGFAYWPICRVHIDVL